MGSPMIMFFSQRTGPGEYRMEVHPPLKPVPGFDLVEGMTRAINNALEEQIRRVPEQWLWFHDRWKSARRAGLL
jgi:KDO2-lipid IV(A) lauroyltransferase